MRGELSSGTLYHIYNRGVSKSNIFLCDALYRRFIAKMAEYKEKYSIDLVMYCLMPNHYHLILSALEKGSDISGFIKDVQCSHSRFFNVKYDHSGHVFQGAFNHRFVGSDAQAQQLIFYLSQNPVRKKLVKKAEDWPYTWLNDKKWLEVTE